MLIRQSKNTFIRSIGKRVYITNQLTKYDCIFNETGADFLNEISREPVEIDVAIDNLFHLYGGTISRDELSEDFNEFINQLVKNKFLILGDTLVELEQHDMSFSYNMENPKTLIYDFSQTIQYQTDEITQDAMLEESQKHPMLKDLQFELTSRCNERCIHCYIPNDKKNHGFDMPATKVYSLIDEYAAMGGLYVTLSGGEVFLHKDILSIIRYCREKDMIISILTNLIALRPEQIPIIKECNVSLIQTSLYSMDPRVHDFITTIKGSHARTKSAIEMLVAADIPVQISCPIMKANAHGYNDVMKYANDLKCKAYTDYIMMAQADFNTSNLTNRISLDETECVIRDILKYDIDYTSNTLKQSSISDEIKQNFQRYAEQPLCGAGLNGCCVTANGDIYPCAGWQALIVGNVYKQSLLDIWENSSVLKKIRKIKQKDFPQCIKCEAKDYCNMCMVRNFNESNGDMFKISEHTCQVAFLNKKIVEEYLSSLNE